MSAKVVQRDLSRCRSRSLWAPRLSSRSGLGVEGVADDVEVHAVLDGLRLRHLVERDTWPAGAPVAGEQDRVLGSGVFGDLAPEDIGPEPGQGTGVGAVKGDCETANCSRLVFPFARRRLEVLDDSQRQRYGEIAAPVLAQYGGRYFVRRAILEVVRRGGCSTPPRRPAEPEPSASSSA